MKVTIQLDNDEQRELLARFLPEGIETEGVTTDDVSIIRHVLLFLRRLDVRAKRREAAVKTA